MNRPNREILGARRARGFAIVSATWFLVQLIAANATAIAPDLQSQFSYAADEFMTDARPVGMAIGYVDENTSFVLGFGTIRAGQDLKPTKETIFEIGSVTKTFTATVLSDLVERGELELDQPVEEIFEGRLSVPTFGDRKITLLDLATHTSGLPRVPGDLLPITGYFRLPQDPYKDYTTSRTAAWLKSHKLRRAPGAKVEYSNLGVGLLGYALATRTSSTCEEMFLRSICGPLGLRDTVITLSPTQQTRAATGYAAPGRKNSYWTMHDNFAGAGALRSTVPDMLRYLEANIGLTSTPLSAAMKAAHRPRCAMDATSSMGLTWMTTVHPGVPGGITWHNGGTGGFSSLIAFSQEARCGVVVLCNTSTDKETRFGFRLLQTAIRNRAGLDEK